MESNAPVHSSGSRLPRSGALVQWTISWMWKHEKSNPFILFFEPLCALKLYSS